MELSKIVRMMLPLQLILAGCSFFNNQTPEFIADEILATSQVIAKTRIAQTSEASIPTLTITPIPVFTPTATQQLPTATQQLPTMTNTTQPSPTTAESQAIVTVPQGVNCRQGPGTNYFVAYGLSDGDTGIIQGRDSQNTWWLIHLTEPDIDCWVFAEIVNASGNLDAVTAVAAPPPPPPDAKSPYIQIYLILLDTGGDFACSDSIFGVSTGQLITGDARHDIGLALDRLFAIEEQFSGGLMYAGYASHLAVSNIDWTESSGRAEITLSGAVTAIPDKCDQERFTQQVRLTVEQFENVNSSSIQINNALLSEAIEP